MQTSALKLPSTRKTVAAVIAAVLAWLVLSHSFAAYLASAAPGAALWLDPRQPDALVNLASEAMNAANVPTDLRNSGLKTTRGPAGMAADKTGVPGAPSPRIAARDFEAFEKVGPNRSANRPIAPANAASVNEWAQDALVVDPLNARALRILGQLAEADADDARAHSFMSAAARLSSHESIAVFWMLRNSVEHKDYPAALHYADILLRAEPLSYAYVVPFLAQISEDKSGAELVEAVLAKDPPWRSQFIATFPADVSDARMPLKVLLALRNDPVPLTAADIKPYIDLLVAHKFYSLAYYTWLQFLPAEELRRVGLLFNGSFEEQPSGLPFDWTIRQGAGVTVDIVPKSDNSDDHALLVDFQFGRVDYQSVTELVMLAPGSYRFNGRYQGKLVGPRGMKWRVVCADGKMTTGGESPMITGSNQKWQTVTFDFTVPPQNCEAQQVKLDLDARMASEEIVSGSILFDDLQISRLVRPATPTP